MKTTEKLPAVLEQSAQESGLELSKAQAIAVNYVPFMEQAQAEAEKLKDLEIGNPEHVATAKRIRIDLGKICSHLKTRKDTDKAIIKIEDRYIMGLFNSVEGFARLTQKDAEEIEKHAEKLVAIERENLKAERCGILAALDVDGSAINVEHMTPEVWENYLNGVKLNHQAKKEAEEKSEAERVEKQRKAILYTERKAQLLTIWDHVKEDHKSADFGELPDDQFKIILNESKEAKQAHDKAQEETRLENERLKKEAEEKEKKAKAEREANEKKLEDERKKREALEKAEADRKATEEKKKKADAAAARKAAKAPDVDKVKAALNACTLDAPEISDAEVIEKLDEITEKFEAFKKWAINKLND